MSRPPARPLPDAERRIAIVKAYARSWSWAQRDALLAKHGITVAQVNGWRRDLAVQVEIRDMGISRHPSDQLHDDTDEHTALVRALLRAAGRGLGEWPREVGDELVSAGRAKIVRDRLYIACVVPGVVTQGRADAPDDMRIPPKKRIGAYQW